MNFCNYNSKNDFDSLISTSKDDCNWNISICLDELKMLFRDLQEITKENFIRLSNHITNMLFIIDKINRCCYKPINSKRSLNAKLNKENDKSNLSGKDIFIIEFKPIIFNFK